MGGIRIATTPVALARALYRYGEPALGDRALALTPDQVEAVGRRLADPGFRDQAHRVWPDGPPDTVYLLAVVTYFNGTPRPCARSTPLPESALPEHLRVAPREPGVASSPVPPGEVRPASGPQPGPAPTLAARLRAALRRHR
ncbi:MAG TPA: hypothetical protein VNA20_02195 [Frankiaceae bacterium]|nr:hypothetical protein [Frankiaceae bacterium]